MLSLLLFPFPFPFLPLSFLCFLLAMSAVDSLFALLGNSGAAAPPMPVNAVTHTSMIGSNPSTTAPQSSNPILSLSPTSSSSSSSSASFHPPPFSSPVEKEKDSSSHSRDHPPTRGDHRHSLRGGHAARSNSNNQTHQANEKAQQHANETVASFVGLSAISPPPYSFLDTSKKSLPKLVYSRKLILRIREQSKLIGQPMTVAFHEIRIGSQSSNHPPLAPGVSSRPAGASTRIPTSSPITPNMSSIGGGGPGGRGPPPGMMPVRGDDKNRWNDLRSDRDFHRFDSRGRGGDGYDRPQRYEATPQWADTEVKSTLDMEDEGIFGDSGGEFVLGAVLDRDADARAMRQMGMGEMFRASEEEEKKAELEREEIRRKLKEEQEQDLGGDFSNDFNELPPDHPLAKSNAPEGDDLERLDELLAAKAKGSKPSAGSSSSIADHAASSSSSSSAAAGDGEEHGGTSKFASRFGFGLTNDDSWDPSLNNLSIAPAVNQPTKADSWGFKLEGNEPAKTAGATGGIDASKFNAAPNIVLQKAQPPPGINSAQAAFQAATAAAATQPVYQKVEVQDIFKMFDTNVQSVSIQSITQTFSHFLLDFDRSLFVCVANLCWNRVRLFFLQLPALPTMPVPGATLPPNTTTPSIASSGGNENSLNKMLNKHLRRKAGGGGPSPPVAHTGVPVVANTPYSPPGTNGSPPPAIGDSPNQALLNEQQNRYQPAQATLAGFLQSSQFASLDPAQQQLYLRQLEQTNANRPIGQPQPQQRLPQPQPGVLPSHYTAVPQQVRPNVNAAGGGFTSGLHQQQQQQQQQQHLLQQKQQQPQQLPQQFLPPSQPSTLPPGMLNVANIRGGIHPNPAPTAPQHRLPQATQPPPTLQHVVHGRNAPTTTTTTAPYGAPAGSGGEDAGGLQRWFAHLNQQTQQLPPPPTDAMHYSNLQFYNKSNPQQQQQPGGAR